MPGHFHIHRALAGADQIAALKAALSEIEDRAGDADKQSVGLMALRHAGDPDVQRAAGQVFGWFWANGLDRIFRERFGDEPALAAEICTVRRHRAGASQTHVGWHFDANFSGFGLPFLIYWVPLDPVGDDAPGLEFCLPAGRFSARALAENWQAVPIAEGRRWIDDAGLPGLFGTDRLRKVQARLAPGDVAVFDEYVLHRTQALSTPSRDRAALEFRAFSPRRPFIRHGDFGRGPAITREASGALKVEQLAALVARVAGDAAAETPPR